MDISTTSSASTGMSSDMTQASVVSKNSSAKNTSFKSEMNKVSEKNNSQTEEKIDTEKKSETKIEGKTAEKENTQNKSTEVKNNNEFESASNFDLEENPILAGEIQYNNLDILNNQMRTLIDANMMLTDAVSDARTPVKVDYSVIKMDMNDAQFFTDLVQDTDKTLQNVALDLSANVESQVKEIQKNVKVSSVLMNALSDAVKNNQSFRIDFDKNISVIIKVDRDGALSARFIPGDTAVENYLKQNISTLRQRFDDQELSYKELSYTGQQKRERRNNKENGHE